MCTEVCLFIPKSKKKLASLAAVSLGSRHFVRGGQMPCLDRDGVLAKSIAQGIGHSLSLAGVCLVLFGCADNASSM